jgi:hypothetical protein
MTRFLLGAAAEGLEAGAASGGSLVRSACATCSKVRDARQDAARSHGSILMQQGARCSKVLDARQKRIEMLPCDHVVYEWRGLEGGGRFIHKCVVSFSEVLV